MGGVASLVAVASLTSCNHDLSDHFGVSDNPSATVTSLTLDEATLRLATTAQTLTATVTPSDATITWSSDKESVATVDATGKVTPVAPGEATITAKAGDKTATSTVYVYDKIVDISTGDLDVIANESWLINGDGTEKTNRISIADGATVTLNNVNIKAPAPIICNGTATIILADGSVNIVTSSSSGEAGIRVGNAPKAFTIDAETAGTGELTVTGGGTFNGGAGIGTRTASGANCGAITIKGGIITATGGGDAAGIGTADAFSGEQQCDVISILGGTVTAIGGENAAGIGTGYAESHDQQCLGILIHGGTVIATGGDYGAGIGTGRAFTGHTQNCVTITIGSGVTSVTANRGSNATNPIGKDAGGGTQTCGTIKFGTTTVFTGTTWNPDPMDDGNYDGLNLAILAGTWTLTPAP